MRSWEGDGVVLSLPVGVFVRSCLGRGHLPWKRLSVVGCLWSVVSCQFVATGKSRQNVNVPPTCIISPDLQYVRFPPHKTFPPQN